MVSSRLFLPTFSEIRPNPNRPQSDQGQGLAFPTFKSDPCRGSPAAFPIHQKAGCCGFFDSLPSIWLPNVIGCGQDSKRETGMRAHRYAQRRRESFESSDAKLRATRDFLSVDVHRLLLVPAFARAPIPGVRLICFESQLIQPCTSESRLRRHVVLCVEVCSGALERSWNRRSDFHTPLVATDTVRCYTTTPLSVHLQRRSGLLSCSGPFRRPLRAALPIRLLLCTREPPISGSRRAEVGARCVPVQRTRCQRRHAMLDDRIGTNQPRGSIGDDPRSMDPRGALLLLAAWDGRNAAGSASCASR